MFDQCGAFLVGFAGDVHVFEEVWQLSEQESLWPINERLIRRRVKINEHHISARNDSLRGRVHHIEDAFRPRVARADGEAAIVCG